MAVSAFGENRTVARWAADERCVVSEGVLARRIHAGWAAEEAITTPFRGPAWQATKRGTLEEDRAKAARRTFIPDPGPYKSRKRVRPSGALKRVAEPAPGWRDAPAEKVTPVQGRSNSIRTIGGGLPTLGKRRC